MAGMYKRGLVGVVLAVVAVGAAGCSDGDNSASSAVSQVASAASEAAEAVDTAEEAAKKKLAEVKDGVDAKDAVKVGVVTADADGFSTAGVTAENSADSPKSFAVQVNFKDKSGNLLDTVVVTVSDVAAGAKGEATARSTHKLSGEVEAQTATALRY
ncbi:FxLYD domain-containing protein [Streptomyces sp. NPDC002082]|uniref:FxLYD domain-containing protein n=1 Tax=Streptomyces sp. NPDC002082 TaxID=3154772 RepID=UPI00332821A3